MTAAARGKLRVSSTPGRGEEVSAVNSLGCDLRQESPESQHMVWTVGAGQEADGTKPQGCPRGPAQGKGDRDSALLVRGKSTGQGEDGAASAEALGVWSVRLNGSSWTLLTTAREKSSSVKETQFPP